MVKKSHSSLKIHLLLSEILFYSKFSLKFIFSCYQNNKYYFSEVKIPIQEWAYTQDQVFG